MRQRPDGQLSRPALLWTLARGAGSSFAHHWALACFSLIAAFGVWFLVQDVENPRTETVFPPESEPASIHVEPRNAGDYIVQDPSPVRVKVEVRKGDIASLQPDDFVATVDVKGQPAGVPVQLPVYVQSKRDGVKVIGVMPPSVTVTPQVATVKDMPVTVRITRPLPDNYKVSDEGPTIDPAIVKVRGLDELVASVASVDLDVNLSGARSDTVVVEGDLVARTEAGNAVTVQLSQQRAKATFKIEQVFAQRTIAIAPSVTGQPAPGYRISNITVDPPVVTVNGPKSVVDSLDSLKGIGIEAVTVTNAKTDITQTRQVDKIPGLSTDRQTVLVKVEIKPIDCGDQTSAPCGGTTFMVSPAFDKVPAGMVVDGIYTVQVRVYGPLAQISTLKPGDVKAVVSLAGGAAGTNPYTVTVSLPAGLRADPVDNLMVTLKGALTP